MKKVEREKGPNTGQIKRAARISARAAKTAARAERKPQGEPQKGRATRRVGMPPKRGTVIK